MPRQNLLDFPEVVLVMRFIRLPGFKGLSQTRPINRKKDENNASESTFLRFDNYFEGSRRLVGQIHHMGGSTLANWNFDGVALLVLRFINDDLYYIHIRVIIYFIIFPYWQSYSKVAESAVVLLPSRIGTVCWHVVSQWLTVHWPQRYRQHPTWAVGHGGSLKQWRFLKSGALGKPPIFGVHCLWTNRPCGADFLVLFLGPAVGCVKMHGT